MNATIDPFEVLLLLRPDVDVSPVRVGDDPQLDALLQRTIDSVRRSSKPTRSRHRRRTTLIGVLLVAVTGTAGGVAWALNRHERAADPTVIACHREARIDSDQLLVTRTEQDPVTTCREAVAAQFPDWGAVPPSVACVMGTGVAGVFPGKGDTCSQLGLAALDTTLDPAGSNLLKFESSLVGELLAGGCLTPQQAAANATDGLHHFDLRGWTVSVTGSYTAERPCGSYAFVPQDRVVLIRPLADHFGS